MKYCPKCGTECEDNAVYCSSCGERLPESGYRPENRFEGNSMSSRDFDNSQDGNRNPDTAKTLGILSLVFGIVGINIVGIILGVVGLNKNPDNSAKSMCIIGIALSVIHLIVQVIIFILAAIGIIDGFFII